MNVRTLLTLAASGALLLAAVQSASAATPATAQPSSAKVFGALDTNHDKALSLQEFEAGYAGLQRAISLEIRLREQFRTVDADHSGAVDTGEFANLLLIKGAGKAAPPLSAFDANGDQKLEFPEYVAVVRKLAAPQPAPVGK
jgi:Ca2+-binding EF-hand superfamily protein